MKKKYKNANSESSDSSSSSDEEGKKSNKHMINNFPLVVYEGEKKM